MPWSVRFICCGKQFKFSVKGDLRVAFFMPQSNTVTLKITALDNATRVINDIKKSLNGLGNDRNNDKLKKTFEPVSRNLTQLREGIVAVSRAVVGFAVLGASTAGLFRFGKAAADTANQIIDISSKYQVGTQSLQVYASLIEGAGGKMEDVGKSMSKLQLAMSEAIRGSAEYQAAFQGIEQGLIVHDFPARCVEEVGMPGEGGEKRAAGQMPGRVRSRAGERGVEGDDVTRAGYLFQRAEVRAAFLFGPGRVALEDAHAQAPAHAHHAASHVSHADHAQAGPLQAQPAVALQQQEGGVHILFHAA